MDPKLLGLLCFLSAITLGSSLTCHMCGSLESMSLCMKYKTPKKCDVWEDRCFKAQVEQTYQGKKYTLYERGCSSSSLCTKKGMQVCKGGAGKNLPLDCDVNCCSGDNCNSAALPAVSAFILVACALLFLLL